MSIDHLRNLPPVFIDKKSRIAFFELALALIERGTSTADDAAGAESAMIAYAVGAQLLAEAHRLPK